MKVNRRIRKYIETSGLKFSHVAEKSDINVKTFSRMMNSKQKISTDEYERICCDGLSLESSYFFDDKFLDSKNKTA